MQNSKELLNEAEMSVKNLSSRLKVSETVIHNWLNGTVKKETGERITMFMKFFIEERNWKRSVLLGYGWEKGLEIIDDYKSKQNEPEDWIIRK